MRCAIFVSVWAGQLHTLCDGFLANAPNAFSPGAQCGMRIRVDTYTDA